LVSQLLHRGLGAVGAQFERIYQAGFDPPDQIQPIGDGFGPMPVVGGGFGEGPQVGADPFGGNGIQVREQPFGVPAGLSGNPFGNVPTPGGNGFGNAPQVSGDPFAMIPKAPQTQVPTKQPTGNTGAGGGAPNFWAGPATADDNKTLTAAQIDAWIQQTRPNSPLIGLGAYILDAANRRGVSAPQMLGIFLKESELGTTAGENKVLSGIVAPNDPGLGQQRQFNGYATWQAAIDATADNLASQLYRGKSLQEQIGYWYVGPEEYKRLGLEATDKAGNGTVRDYLNMVTQVYQALGIPIDATAAPTLAGGGAGSGTLVQAAQSRLGYGYELGGRRAGHSTWDCSESTAYWYEQIGVQLPWNAQAQYNMTARVERGQWQVGDLIFFSGTNPSDPDTVTHVGMFVGYDANGRPMMINSQTGGTMYAYLDDSYWTQHYFGAGRVIQ